MTKSRLWNKFKQDRAMFSNVAQKKEQNICVKLLRKTKKQFFNNLDVKYVTDNKQFWKTVEPCLTDKTLKGERITLIENGNVVSDKRELGKSLMSTFKYCTKLRYSKPSKYYPSP